MTARRAIEEVEGREMARVAGRVVSIQVEPNDAPPAFTVRIDDGTGRLDAIFMGRRDIPGLAPGGRIELEGRMCRTTSLPRVYNPRYTLIGAR